MRKRWLMCALFVTLAWGQAVPGAPAPSQPAQAPEDASAAVPPGAPVITPCSLPAAMIDPENVTDPMITSSSVVIVVDSAGPTTALATRM